MNNNTIKRLADNPHYAMNDKELEALAKLLHDEAEAAKTDETPKVRKVNKNRVTKTTPTLTKTPTLQEDNTDVDERR